MKPRFFATPAELRRFLRAHHASSQEQWIGFYKRASGRPSVTYKQALDEALCHGWIDGVRKSLDAERWMIRFSPRRPRSFWSQVNLKRMAELLAAGQVSAAGKRVYEARERRPRTGYSYENRPKRLAPAREKAFRAEAAAWAFFAAQAPSYQRAAFFWIEGAAKDETKARRLASLIEVSRRGERLGPLSGKPRKQ